MSTMSPTRMLSGVRHTGALPALTTRPDGKRAARATKALHLALGWVRNTSFWVGV